MSCSLEFSISYQTLARYLIKSFQLALFLCVLLHQKSWVPELGRILWHKHNINMQTRALLFHVFFTIIVTSIFHKVRYALCFIKNNPEMIFATFMELLVNINTEISKIKRTLHLFLLYVHSCICLLS